MFDRRRKPGPALVEALRSEAARLGADAIVGVRLEPEEARDGLHLRLRGRAVRISRDEPSDEPSDAPPTATPDG
jgi:uncharacterized protein YbjQ (UPF0145 family)